MTSRSQDHTDALEKGSTTTLAAQTPRGETPAEKHLTTPKDAHEVTLEPHEDPKALPLWRRWTAAMIVILGAVCVTGSSSIVSTLENCPWEALTPPPF